MVNVLKGNIKCNDMQIPKGAKSLLDGAASSVAQEGKLNRSEF